MPPTASWCSPVHPCLIALLVLAVVVVVVALVYCNTVHETFASADDTATPKANAVENEVEDEEAHDSPVQTQSCAVYDANNAYNNHHTYSSFGSTGYLQDAPTSSLLTAPLPDNPTMQHLPVCSDGNSDGSSSGGTCTRSRTMGACYLSVPDTTLAQKVLQRLYGDTQTATLLKNSKPPAGNNDDDDDTGASDATKNASFFKDAQGYVHIRQYNGVCSTIEEAQEKMKVHSAGNPPNTYTPLNLPDTDPCSLYQVLGSTAPDFVKPTDHCGFYSNKDYTFRVDLQATVKTTDQCKFPSIALTDPNSPFHSQFQSICDMDEVQKSCTQQQPPHSKHKYSTSNLPYYTQVFHYAQIELSRNVTKLQSKSKTYRIMVFLKENQSYSDNPFSSASSGSYVDGELSDISPSDMTAQIHNEDEGESKTYYIKSLLPSLRRIELSQQLNSQPTSYGYTISTTPKPTSSSDGGGVGGDVGGDAGGDAGGDVGSDAGSGAGGGAGGDVGSDAGSGAGGG